MSRVVACGVSEQRASAGRGYGSRGSEEPQKHIPRNGNSVLYISCDNDGGTAALMSKSPQRSATESSTA